VRLTVGGEPTFIAADDMDGPGVEHRGLGPAQAGTRREALQAVFSPSTARAAFVHYGQGKWYPGEPLPRWVLACYWRKDGKPALARSRAARRSARSREPTRPPTPAGSPRARPAPGPRRGAARPRLRGHVLPRLAGAADSRRVRSQGDEPERPRRAGAPRRDAGGRPRCTGRLRPAPPARPGRPLDFVAVAFRRGPDVPGPGDSPMGLRLPLSLQPWRHARARSGPSRTTEVRIALCVEARGGHVHVFLPPADRAEDYLALLAAVEATAASLGPAGRPRRLSAAERSGPGQHQGHARPGRDRGQHQPLLQLAGTLAEDRVALRRRPRMRALRREVHGRRQARGDGRGQPRGARRPDARGQPAPAQAPPAEEPGRLLAPAPRAQLPLQRALRRPHQPEPADRRGAQ
jgi:hypothetical protein